MADRLSRRSFLGAAGVAAVGASAGCVSDLRSFVEPRIHDEGIPPSAFADAQFRGGLQRHGVYPDASIPETARVDWVRRDINTGDHTAAKASAVAAPNGDVVVPGDSGYLWRFTPDGEAVWKAHVSDATRGIHGTPVIANGAVYVGAYDGVLYAFDLDTGERFWRADLGDAIGSSPAYHDGTVYIAVEYYTPSGAMFGVDAVTGNVTWADRRPTNHPHSSCAIDRDAGRLVVGSNDGKLYAWSYPDMEFQWTFPTDEPIKGPVATYDGAAFFGSWDGRVYRVNLEDGSEDWNFETGSLVMSGPSIEPATGTVYVGSHDTNLYALDAATGDEQWAFDTGGQLIGCPTVAGDHVLVGSYDGHCYAIETASGDETWRVEGVGRVTSTPLVVDGAVYFTDRASQAYLDGTSGGDGDDGGGDDDGDGGSDGEDGGGGKSGGLYRVVADE